MRAAAARALQQFRVDPALLEQALAELPPVDADALDDAVWDALRDAARGGLDTLAQRITSGSGLDDIVLPPLVASQLREIGSQLRHRMTVYEEWGFAAGQARGLGIAALFAGESGTGKTHGRRSHRQRAAARPLPHRPGQRGQQVHRRNREEPAPSCSTPPRPAARCCCSTRPTRCSASAAR